MFEWIRNISRETVIRSLLFLFFIGVCIGGFIVCTVEGVTVKFLDWVGSIGYWGYFFFILAFILIGFPFAYGYTILGLGVGFLYHIVIGTIIMAIGTNIGSALSFWACRKLLNTWIETKIEASPKLSAIFHSIGDHGFKIALLLRFIPIPFGIQNAIMGISSVTFIRYAIGTFIGLLPEQIVITYFGSTLNKLSNVISGDVHLGKTEKILLIVQLVMIVVLMGVLTYIGRRALQKMTKENEEKQKALRENEDNESVTLLNKTNENDNIYENIQPAPNSVWGTVRSWFGSTEEKRQPNNFNLENMSKDSVNGNYHEFGLTKDDGSLDL